MMLRCCYWTACIADRVTVALARLRRRLQQRPTPPHFDQEDDR